MNETFDINSSKSALLGHLWKVGEKVSTALFWHNRLRPGAQYVLSLFPSQDAGG